MKKKHYILSTHWDRSYYETFQQFRHRFIELMDEVLEAQSNGDLRGPFQMDGQVLPIFDYLEIYPERRQEMEALSQSGKIALGPWLVMPDVNLVSGESLIRNLEAGQRLCRDLKAEPSDMASCCDSFGFNSQMPQILKKSGVDGIAIWRGINHPSKRHATWEGADGSEVMAHLFSNCGYWAYSVNVRDVDNKFDDFDAERLKKRLVEHIAVEEEASECDAVMLFDGMDHAFCDQRALKALYEVMEGRDDFAHSTLSDYLHDLQNSSQQPSLRLKGEQLEPSLFDAQGSEQQLLAGVWSNRHWLRQNNMICESALLQKAEPAVCLESALFGKSHGPAFLREAWMWLLQNHFHDDICGSSIDPAHDDMMHRYRQSQQIAQKVQDRAQRSLGYSCFDKLNENEVGYVCFNYRSENQEGMAVHHIDLPEDWENFELIDPQGEKVEVRPMGEPQTVKIYRITHDCGPITKMVKRWAIATDLKVPSMGYSAYKARRKSAENLGRNAETSGAQETCILRHGAVQDQQLAVMENDELQVQIQANGTLNIWDKGSDQHFENLMIFEDVGDIGSCFQHEEPFTAERHTSINTQPQFRVLVNNHHGARVQLNFKLSLPQTSSAQGRSEQRNEVHIQVQLELLKGCGQLNVECDVNNCIKDHRLRLLFPTGRTYSNLFTDTPFDVIHRPFGVHPARKDYIEKDKGTAPMQNFMGCADANGGLAIVAPELYEAGGVQTRQESVMALTLLRSTGKYNFSEGENVGNQELGQHHFSFCIVPWRKQTRFQDLYTLAHQLNGGLQCEEIYDLDYNIAKSSGATAPLQMSLLSIEGGAQCSSARMLTPKRLQIRCFNPSKEALQLKGSFDTERFNNDIKLVDFRGQSSESFKLNAQGELQLPMKSKEIITLELELS